jgi:hypothetical protein
MEKTAGGVPTAQRDELSMLRGTSTRLKIICSWHIGKRSSGYVFSAGYTERSGGVFEARAVGVPPAAKAFTLLPRRIGLRILALLAGTPAPLNLPHNTEEMSEMKRFAITLALILGFYALVATTHPVAAADSSSFSGEIMDKDCADMGSHDAMMKKEGAKTAKECTLNCVKAGSALVLYDASKNVVYQLDNQSEAMKHAGEKVTVQGSYDEGTKTIHVDSISTAAM